MKTAFQALAHGELNRLKLALRQQGEDARTVLLMDPKDTSFAGTSFEVPDDEVIRAVKSVPMHY